MEKITHFYLNLGHVSSGVVVTKSERKSSMMRGERFWIDRK